MGQPETARSQDLRLFKDSVYGSDEVAYKTARAYRDAIIEAIPPATNHEQAVLLRKNNQSGILGVRRIQSREGDAWQATLMTNDGQKRENFTVWKFGELAAKSMAIAQRRKWLADLPVTHLAYAHHAAEVAQEHFADDLIPVGDVMPETHLKDDKIEARIQSINDEFDSTRPKRLRVRVKYYHGSRLSVFVSDAGKPAKRKLVQINTRKLGKLDVLTEAKAKVQAAIAEFYDPDTAKWFMEAHGTALLKPYQFDLNDGFNVLVLVENSADTLSSVKASTVHAASRRYSPGAGWFSVAIP